MEEQFNPLAVTHLLQQTLRSLCLQDNSHWVYAVFWRILPRNYPPPKWDFQGGPFDRTRGNRRNWILVWEDGFCNFAASRGDHQAAAMSSSSVAAFGGDCENLHMKGLQPELFFKMSHEIYNYGEGVIGKVAADHNHKWVFKDPQDQEINFLSGWSNPADLQPRTWEAQFESGIKTIALIAVREGVVQLGATNKVAEDLSFVLLLRKKFSYLESIPGVLLPHPSSTGFPPASNIPSDCWPYSSGPATLAPAPPFPMEFMYDPFITPQVRITPSMSSLEALLSKLPSVVPVTSPTTSSLYYEVPPSEAVLMAAQTEAATAMELTGVDRMVKEEIEEELHLGDGTNGGGGECSSSLPAAYYHLNVGKSSEDF